jgi:hypothetical protein
MGLENLRAHKLRSLLTMLGMIFGVAAVVAMLSIGAGAQQEVMSFIEQLGVRNLIVEAREAPDSRRCRRSASCRRPAASRTSGSSRRTSRASRAASARKRFTPSKLLPKPQGDSPIVYGVSPATVDRQPAASRRPVLRRGGDDGGRAGRGARGRRGGGAVRHRRTDRAALPEGERAVVSRSSASPSAADGP